jgi:hypothetical protein
MTRLAGKNGLLWIRVAIGAPLYEVRDSEAAVLAADWDPRRRMGDCDEGRCEHPSY